MSCSGDENDEEDNELENLFFVRDTEDEEFVFEGMKLYLSASNLELIIEFSFRFCELSSFTSKLHVGLPTDFGGIETLNLGIRRTAFSIGMCVLHWFWMGFAAARIVVSLEMAKEVELTRDMMEYWREAYTNMTAEFLYLNKLAHKIVTLQVEEGYIWPTESLAHHDIKEDERNGLRVPSTHDAIVPLGGGKDSLVVLQMARDDGLSPLLVYVSDGLGEFERNWRLPAIVKAVNCDVVHVRHVFVDETFIRLCRSYLAPCGHPWAAVVLYDTLLVAQIRSIPQVLLGFEKSADEGNGVFVQDIEVNHQYDKSSRFLALSAEYIRQHLTSSTVAKSALHHLWELEIARLFCTLPPLETLHGLFLSCNSPVDHAQWCGKCEKCAFICLLLAAWRGVDYVHEMVFRGDRMLHKAENTNVFLSLLGSTGSKPFDCVGTVEEATEAVSLILQHYSLNSSITGSEATDLPCVLKSIVDFIAARNMKTVATGHIN